jgi:peptide deformylase
MILPIRKFGDLVLVRRADAVTVFDKPLRAFVDNMFETMYAAAGVGLAAPQVGDSRRIFVMDCSTERRQAQRVAMINPEILEFEGNITATEGCLSVPGMFAELGRPERLRARGQALDGSLFEITVEGLEARCVAHECDHLDGTLYIERLGPLRRDLIKRKIKKLQRLGDW